MGEWAAKLRPCWRCKHRTMLIQQTEYTYGKGGIWISCSRCTAWQGSGVTPKEAVTAQRRIINGHGYARWERNNVPKWYRRAFGTKPTRAAERRFIQTLMGDCEATEIESELNHHDRRFKRDYW